MYIIVQFEAVCKGNEGNALSFEKESCKENFDLPAAFLMRHYSKQAGENELYIGRCFAFFRRWFRHEPAAFFYFGCLSLTARCYLIRFGSPRMGFVSGSAFAPADVHRRTRSAAQGRLGSAVHAPPYIRVGRENGVV